MRFPYNNFKNYFTTTAGNPYGEKVSYGYHSGIDVNGKVGGNTDCGQPIFALSNGICTSVEKSNNGYGNHIHIKIEGVWGVRWSHHCHLQDLFVKEGDVLSEGQKIATIGSTGNSTACHDHWEIKKKAVGINSVAKTKESLADGWENPVEFVTKYMQGGDTPMDDIQKIKDERDTNWNIANKIAKAVDMEIDPNDKEGSSDSVVRAVNAYKGNAAKAEDLEKQVNTIKSAYESELAVVRGTVLSQQDTIAQLQLQNSDLVTPYIDQLKAKDEQIGSMAEEIRKLQLNHPKFSLWELIKRFIPFA